MLSYLVLEAGQDIQRATLAELFWPQKEHKKARASLRQSLSDIRKISGNTVIHANGTNIFVDRSSVSTDIEELFESLDQGLVNQETLVALSALPEVLNGFESTGSRFEDWVREIQARFLSEALARGELALHQERLDTKQRKHLAQALLKIDGLNESSVRALIEAFASLGDNAAALRVYHHFYGKLEEELGVEPALETQELAVNIKLGLEPSATIVTTDKADFELPSLRPLTMVAVLPFERLGSNDVPDFVILGMLDHITCKLAAFPAPAVISSNSTRQYLGSSPKVTEVAHTLGVSYVLTGTIVSAGENVVLSVQLCDGLNGRVHWASAQEVPLSETFSSSLEIAGAIAQALEPSINLAELERARSLPSDALEPHHLVLNAKDMMFQLSQPGFQRAGKALNEALQIGPNFAPAHALAAEWHAITLWQGWSNNVAETRSRLEEHSRRAIYLAPNNGRALAQWGHHKITLNRDYEGALSLFEQALELWPNDSETLFWTVPTLAHTGQSEQAIQHGEKALRLSPFDPFLHRNEHFLSIAYYAGGKFDESIRLGLSSFSRAPTYASNIRITIAALVESGRMSEARDLAQAHKTAEPSFSMPEFRQKMGFRDPVAQDRYVEMLATAGVEQ